MWAFWWVLLQASLTVFPPPVNSIDDVWHKRHKLGVCGQLIGVMSQVLKVEVAFLTYVSSLSSTSAWTVSG